MPKTTQSVTKTVEFTRQEVWDALRLAYPDLKMPKSPVDEDTGDSYDCAINILTQNNKEDDCAFEDGERFVIHWLMEDTQPVKPKQEPQLVRLRVWEEFKTHDRFNTLPAPVWLGFGIGATQVFQQYKGIGKVVAVHGPVYRAQDTRGVWYTLVDADVMVEPEHLELAQKYEVKSKDLVEAAYEKYPFVVDCCDNDQDRRNNLTKRLIKYIGNLTHTGACLSSITELPEIARKVGDNNDELVYREWIAPERSGKASLMIVSYDKPGKAIVVRSTDTMVDLG